VFSLLFLIFIFSSLSFSTFFYNSIYFSPLFFLRILFVCWFISCIAERNRSPFDFSEGESELVSGFNTEYGGGLFSIIFVGEYSSIILLSFFTSVLFVGSFTITISIYMFSFGYLWIRVRFPRLRYDFLIMIAWKGLVFLVVAYFFAFFYYF
jgi:NADH-ubiquinone oxidoreductase chain 1